MTKDEKIIKDAQYRKGLSIAFFNATNAAIALVAGNTNAFFTLDKYKDEEVIRKVIEIRDRFLDEHKKYYSEVIAGVGANYNAEETIKKLKQCDTKDKLRLVWISISEDERRDGEIIKIVKDIKASFK